MDNLTQQWAWAIFGVILYNYLSFVLEKDKSDEEHKKFVFRTYRDQRWDNWVWSLLCVPVVVVYGDQLFYYLMRYFEKDWEFKNVVYLSAGVLAEGLYYLLRKVALISRALSGKKS